MAKNRQQLLKERNKRQRLEERLQEKKAKKRMDIVDHMATFVYDRIIELTLLPFIQKEFRFSQEKTELFLGKLAEHEVYNEMYRTNEPIDLLKLRQWRPTDDAYRKINIPSRRPERYFGSLATVKDSCRRSMMKNCRHSPNGTTFSGRR